MPDDPIFVALQRGQPLTPEIVEAATKYRFAQIDELWAEVRILEKVVIRQADPRSALAERDPPIETAKRSSH
uniref:Uncharacterized protein n=1 Tax=viral metagenome TaxID=1070528 RepID=A0A6M3LVR7_9ZZZZ